jgi:beta-glucosidase
MTESVEDEGRIERLLEQLTVEESIRLVSGSDTWHTAEIDRLGIPALKVTDGPSGARGATFGSVTSASFPCGSALGATWNPDLLREVGMAIATEVRRKGAQVLLGPTINLIRHPLAGRNFECYSEDPFLTSVLATAYVKGVQSRGVAATAKHFVANDSEHQRHTISSEVSERALRELYLAPFEAVVKAGVWAIMAAYNRVNGVYAAEHPLLSGVLKREWGFSGLVMSDWWGTASTVRAAVSGLDLEMPGPPTRFGHLLAKAIEDGEVPHEVLKEKNRRLLRLALRVGALDDRTPETPEVAIDDPQDRELIYRAAVESAVLLRNNRLLPLDPHHRIALIGPLARYLAVQGGGSAYVEPHRTADLLSSIERRAISQVIYEQGCTLRDQPSILEHGLITEVEGRETDGLTIEFLDGETVLSSSFRRRLQLSWLGDPLPGVVTGAFSLRASATFVPEHSGDHMFTISSVGPARLWLNDVCVVDNSDPEPGRSFYGAGSAERRGQITLEAGRRYQLQVTYEAPGSGGVRGVMASCLPPCPPDLLDRAVRVAQDADVAIVVVGTGPELDREGADRPGLTLPGGQDELVTRVAGANQRTVVVVNAGAPVTMPWVHDVAAILWVWLPGQEADEALADILFGAAEPSGRLPVSIPRRLEDCPSHLRYPGEEDHIVYSEDIFMGYRGLERSKIVPLFPFGHGGSYTSFALGNATLHRDASGSTTVALEVANTGKRRGSTTVQVYVAPPPDSKWLRPPQELGGFAKVFLDPGERRQVEMTLDTRVFQVWSTRQASFVTDPGIYKVRVATSSSEILEELELEVPA